MAFTRPDNNVNIWRQKPDIITGQAETVKADFDRLLNDNTNDFRDFLDELEAGTAASNIGAVGGTVQQALDNRLAKDNEEAYTPTAAYHPATKAYVDGIALEAGAVTSVFGRAGYITAQAGDYTAAMVGAAEAGHTHTLSGVTGAGTAAAKDSVTSITASGVGLPTSGSVYSFVTSLLGRTTGAAASDTNYATAMARGIKAGTTDLTAGTSTLTSGTIYIVYE